MPDDKIKISWDDIRHPEIDEKMRQRAALERTQQQYAQAMATPSASPTTSLWYNTIVYMALFGLVGGGVAWLFGEMVRLAFPEHRSEFGRYMLLDEGIDDAIADGEITEEQGVARRAKLKRRYPANPFVAILSDDSLNEGERNERLQSRLLGELLRSFVQNLIFMALLGIVLSLFLSIADHVVAQNWRAVIINGASGVALGLLGGMVVGLFINFIYKALGGGNEDSSFAVQVFARTVGWAILGMFLAIAPGVVLLNWKRLLIGLAGGFVGGFVGGILFDVVAMAIPDTVMLDAGIVSRMIAITAFGLLAGLATGLIELAAKTGWLRVAAGLIAGKQFVIYKNPTIIGSSPQSEIYLFKDTQVAPQHACIHSMPGGYDLEDLRSTTGTLVNGRRVSRTRLRINDQIQIGSTTLQFQEKPRS